MANQINEHPFTDYEPNTTMYWEGSDTEKRWNSNIRHSHSSSYKRLKEFGWFDAEPIEYNIDSNGFRNTNDIDISKSIMTLGCSFTFGTGLHEKDIWPTLLGKKFGGVYNCGVGGASADQCYRIARTLIPEHKPKAVFLLTPDKNRTEVISEFMNLNRPMNLSIWNESTPVYKDYLKLKSDEFSQLLQQERNVLSIKRLCGEENIPFVYLNYENLENLYANTDTDIDLFNSTGQARDLLHAGLEFHNILTDMMWTEFKQVMR